MLHDCSVLRFSPLPDRNQTERIFFFSRETQITIEMLLIAPADLSTIRKLVTSTGFLLTADSQPTKSSAAPKKASAATAADLIVLITVLQSPSQRSPCRYCSQCFCAGKKIASDSSERGDSRTHLISFSHQCPYRHWCYRLVLQQVAAASLTASTS